MNKLTNHFRASAGFALIAVFCLAAHLLQLSLVVAAFAGVLALVVAIVGVFASVHALPIDLSSTASATVDEDELAPETRVHVEIKETWEQRGPAEVLPFSSASGGQNGRR